MCLPLPTRVVAEWPLHAPPPLLLDGTSPAPPLWPAPRDRLFSPAPSMPSRFALALSPCLKRGPCCLACCLASYIHLLPRLLQPPLTQPTVCRPCLWGSCSHVPRSCAWNSWAGVHTSARVDHSSCQQLANARRWCASAVDDLAASVSIWLLDLQTSLCSCRVTCGSHVPAVQHSNMSLNVVAINTYKHK